MTVSLRREWPGRSVLANGKHPKIQDPVNHTLRSWGWGRGEALYQPCHPMWALAFWYALENFFLFENKRRLCLYSCYWREIFQEHFIFKESIKENQAKSVIMTVTELSLQKEVLCHPQAAQARCINFRGFWYWTRGTLCTELGPPVCYLSLLAYTLSSFYCLHQLIDVHV